MRAIQHPSNTVLTFKNGYLEKVEMPIGEVMLKIPFRSIEFLDDLMNWQDSQKLGKKIPVNEMMQWITKNNTSINVEIVSAEEIKFNNIKL